jgi:hypothetical protein
MQIVAIYGNPRNGGFVHACLDTVVERLVGLGAGAERLALRDIVDLHVNPAGRRSG